MATCVFPPPLSGMTKHRARQLNPGTWALRLGLGLGMGSWNLCLRDSECLVASVSQVTQVSPSWKEPGWTMNTMVSSILRLLLPGGIQSGPFSAQVLVSTLTTNFKGYVLVHEESPGGRIS